MVFSSQSLSACSMSRVGCLRVIGTVLISICHNQVTYTNAHKRGDLSVSKTIAGDGADQTEKFTFTVTLGDTSISGTYGDMTFINGVATFQLGHGESAKATGLPAGLAYTVTEANKSYTVTSTGKMNEPSIAG